AALAAAIRADQSIAGTPLVLLTSVGEEGSAALFAAVLTKPARPAQLLKTLTSALGLHISTASALGATPPSAPVDDDCDSGSAPLVLVVEDTAVSQLVAKRILQKLGCRVHVVGNGREAVAAVASVCYAVVFMDIQMPEMDGFEATAEIRRRENAQPGLSHLTIIAMTANAMEGDLQRCLASGMDDYVSKPVRWQQLEIVLRRWVPFANGTAQAA
ncbi:MAG: response regulator, partial [Chloroflexota bacterium]